MAISQTMSNNPSDWLLPVYHTDFPTAPHIHAPPQISPVHLTPANTNSGSTPNAPARNTTTTTSIPAADHGRISKPIRRRSRASRRTPTTLLNTDATNFRAMVQQFTGGPAAQFAAAPHIPSGGAMLGFEPPVAVSAAPAAGGFQAAYADQLQQAYGMDSGVPPYAAAESDYGNYMMLR